MKKIICSVLTAMLLLSLVLPCFAASTAPVSQDVPVREIAIVFDNSGTMYVNPDTNEPVTAWCRATYATEIFAAMLNKGDTLKVFPMNPVTTDGSTVGGSTDPITVTSTADISKIHNMYAVNGSNADTPIETITDAYNSLLGSTADEKWLVVLTDGTQFYENGDKLTENATREKLTEVLTEYSQNVNVQYLGIGTTAGSVPDTGDSQNLTVTLANSSDAVIEKLSEVCNNIFGRDELPAQYINGNALSFDVSMSKLIVLVQGNDASVTGLKDSNGNAVSEVADSRYDVTYSPAGSPVGEADTSLNGVVVSFEGPSGEGISAGDYTLEATGNVKVYYAPDVSLQVMLINQDTGEEEYLSDDSVDAGNYTLEFGLIDNETGEISESGLLGEPTYLATKTVNGVETEIENGETVNFSPEDGEVQLKVSATFLDNYHVELGENGSGFTFSVKPAEAGNLSVTLSGGQTEYSLSKLEEGEPITAAITLDGEPLTDEQLDALQLEMKYDAEPEDSQLSFEYNRLYGQSAVEIRIRYGNESDPDTSCGDYTVWVDASLENENGEPAESNHQDELKFSVVDNLPGLEMNISGPGYVARSEMDEKANYLVELSYDGEPLTEEEFNKLNLHVDFGESDEVEYTVTPLPDQSAYSIQILDSDGLKNGSHELTATVTGEDSIGRPVELDCTQKFQISPLPQWAWWLIVLLVLLFVIAFVVFFLNLKVLPRHISLTGAVLTVGYNEPVSLQGSAATARLTKKGSKFLRIQVKASVSFNITLYLKAISPRYKRNDREAQVTKISAGSGVAEVGIGPRSYMRSGKNVFADSLNPDKPVTTNIRNNTKCTMHGEFLMPATGRREPVDFECKLVFRKK